MASFPDYKRRMPPLSSMYELCIDESLSDNKKQDVD